MEWKKEQETGGEIEMRVVGSPFTVVGSPFTVNQWFI